jgi:hypothetical protein
MLLLDPENIDESTELSEQEDWTEQLGLVFCEVDFSDLAPAL